MQVLVCLKFVSVAFETVEPSNNSQSVVVPTFGWRVGKHINAYWHWLMIIFSCLFTLRIFTQRKCNYWWLVWISSNQFCLQSFHSTTIKSTNLMMHNMDFVFITNRSFDTSEKMNLFLDDPAFCLIRGLDFCQKWKAKAKIFQKF